MARPSKYSEELATEICKAIASSSKGLVTLCNENKSFPHPDTIYEWLKVKAGFSDKYVRARELQADFLADEIVEIADDDKKDKILVEGKGGAYYVEDKEWTSRAKLRVDARKWKASKLAPKKYGDKVDVTTNGEKITGQVFEIGFKKPDDSDKG